MLIKYFLTLIISCFLLIQKSYTAESVNYIERPAVQTFIQEMEQQHSLKRSTIESLLQAAQKDAITLKYIQKPAERLEWKQYESLLIRPTRVTDGVVFWKKHAAMLQEAEKRYGVPAKIIVAILGIETSYGKNTGNHRVLDALTTLSFDYAPRAAFFKKELAQFLLLTHELKTIDPLTITGSYAGAIGIPQFMPSSYRNFAIDSDRKGYSNLLNHTQDVIFSVAHYLQKNGWDRNASVVLPAYYESDKPHTPHRSLRKLIDNGTVQTLSQWNQHNIYLHPAISQTNLPLARLIKLDERYSTQYWFTLHNFSVIKTYNNSVLYSMAVYKLSELLENGYKTSR